MATPHPLQEQMRLFTGSLGRKSDSEVTPEEANAIRRIVLSLGQDAEATQLAAAYARGFRIPLPVLADELEHPEEATLRMTGKPPTGGALVAATAIRRGQTKRDGGDSAEAERCFRWARQCFQSVGSREGESLALTLLGRVAQVHERLEEAEQCYTLALALDAAVGNRQDEGIDLGLLAQVAWLRGKLDDAERLAHQAMALHRETHDVSSAATTLRTLAEVARERKHRWEAGLYFLRANLADFGLM